MTENTFSSMPWLKSYPVDIDYGAEIPQKTMVELFDDSVKKYGDRVALGFMGRKTTYREMGEAVDRFARALQDQGYGKGSTVGICLPNTPFYPIAYYGALKAGAKVVNFNPTSPPDVLAQQINDSGTETMVAINLLGEPKQPLYPNVEAALGATKLKQVIVCDLADALPPAKGIPFKIINKLVDVTDGKDLFKPLNAKLKKVRDEKGVKPVAKIPHDGKHVLFSHMMKSKGAPKKVKISPEDVAVLQYTGGTTGVPKAATLTHGNLASNVQQAGLWFSGGKEAENGEKFLAALPFFHVFSMTVMMNLALHSGAELDMMAKPDIVPLLKIIDEEKPTVFAGVPTLYQKLADHKNVADYDLSSLRLCVSGGAPLPEKTMKAWKDLTGSELVEGYGLSETSPIVLANPVNGVKKAGTIGMPVPGTEIRFADIDFPDKSVPIHMEGEICLRGPQVMKEYFGKPAETAQVFDKDGFFHTGDIGVMDKDGYVSITDRKKDMIIVNGFKAFPKKIEEAIRKFPGVSEVIVIGIPDANTGEAVKAFVQPQEGKTVDAKQLVEFLKDKLTHYELPRAANVEFRAALPLTQIGKPDKKPLKEEEAKKTAQRRKTPAPGV